ncbi:hypothetical protein FRX31_024163, partial [Thalictrum thalictroides]
MAESKTFCPWAFLDTSSAKFAKSTENQLVSVEDSNKFKTLETPQSVEGINYAKVVAQPKIGRDVDTRALPTP